MIKNIIIHWEHYPYYKSRGLDDAFIYALSKGKELLYVGKSYRTTAKSEMCAHAYLKNLNKDELTIWLGHVENIDGRRSKNLIDDIESYIIYWYQPPLNRNKKDEYVAITEMRIVNMDFPFPTINLSFNIGCLSGIENFTETINAVQTFLKDNTEASFKQIQEEDDYIYEIHFSLMKLRIIRGINNDRIYVGIRAYTKRNNGFIDVEKQIIKQIIICLLDNLK